MSVVKNKRDGELSVTCGVATAAVTAVLDFCEGDFAYEDPVEGEPIAILNRIGELDHVKANDPHNGFGKCTFSAKYVNKNIKDKLCTPAATTAVEADGIPSVFTCVNMELALKDEAGDLEETIYVYNVFFDPGKVVYKDGDNYSTLTAEGYVFGKYDDTADNDRRFSETVTET